VAGSFRGVFGRRLPICGDSVLFQEKIGNYFANLLIFYGRPIILAGVGGFRPGGLTRASRERTLSLLCVDLFFL
jgi:hypothetical protein